MSKQSELLRLHSLQTDLALKRDWVGVARMEVLIESFARRPGFPDTRVLGASNRLTVH